VCLNAENRAKTEALRLPAELCPAAKTFSNAYETIKKKPELTNRGFFNRLLVKLLAQGSSFFRLLVFWL